MPSETVSRLRPTAVNRVLAEMRELQAKGAQLVSLMRGEPDFKTPPHIVEAADRAMRAGRTNYPDNRGERNLREAVAARYGCNPATEVLVTTGATMGIYCAMAALLNPGDRVMMPEPIYDAYQSPIRLVGGDVTGVSGEVVNGRFQISVEALEQAYTPEAKVLLLNTPWNPVGTVYREDELRAIGEFVIRHDLTLISDEIYEAITYDGCRHVSPLTLSPELRARTILVNSLSKTYAMTGWRVGYTVAPREIVDAMLLVLQQSSRGPATFVQDAAAEALTASQDCVAEMQREYARRRARVSEVLAGVDGIRVLAPEGGFFTMVDTKGLGEPSDVTRRRLLEKHSVVVIHGAAYGAAGEGTLRVAFSSGATLEEGLSRLRRGLADRAA